MDLSRCLLWVLIRNRDILIFSRGKKGTSLQLWLTDVFIFYFHKYLPRGATGLWLLVNSVCALVIGRSHRKHPPSYRWQVFHNCISLRQILNDQLSQQEQNVPKVGRNLCKTSGGRQISFGSENNQNANFQSGKRWKWSEHLKESENVYILNDSCVQRLNRLI